ncbi:SusC/RagA family TonB-linked outer membrane protein [Mucilaginibacter lacusdianchii]|uniref:SusC/RagA family TonB-linked outer membrane protein n=1 Tax=Mucilaginibacter lacusdianchii TaxID=2684211 RepID=UPI00131EB2D6|nr:TonB-dependent receptor [Mucilaginibacter sp. JXJ CY 39]
MRKNYFKNFALVCVLFLLSSMAYAQTGSITGKVLDEKGETLPGVSVSIVGTTQGGTSDVNGVYRINNVRLGTYTVSAAFVGYTALKKSVTVTTGATVSTNFQLTPESKALNEVVVIGYGTQTRKDVTGAVTTVTSRDFQKGVITTPEQLIAGKAAGVSVTSNGGAPGSGSTIRIRGGASLNASNNPLIVVDGVPLSDNSISGSPNPLSLINPNDIESFSVLKDASAAAIYGSRASNGVVLITTKKGQSGAPQINFSTQFSLSKISKKADVLTADEFRNYVNTYGNATQKALLGTANTDWQNEIYQTAKTTDNNLSVSGTAGKVLPYRVSAGYLDQEGILKTGELKRTSLAVNLSPTLLKDHLKVNLNLKGAESRNRFADQGAISSAVLFDPTKPVYSGNNNFGGYYEWLDPSATTGLKQQVPRNPLGLLDQRFDKSTVYRSIGNLQLDYKVHFLPDLHVNLNLGYDVSKGTGTIFVPDYAASNFLRGNGNTVGGINNQYKQTQTNRTIEAYLSYNKDIKSIDSKIEAVAGYAFYDYKTTDYTFADYSAGGVLITNTSVSQFPYNSPQNRLLSYYGRLNYSFKDKYLLTATVRTDGSSRFNPNTRFATFPSAALAWRVKEESFLKNVSFLSDLKLRAGYGITGQQEGLGNYDYLSFYSQSTNTAQYQFGDTYYTMYRPGALDPGRKWEQTATTNIGIDYGFLNGRISGTIEYYYKKTKDLLSLVNQPAGTNFSNRIVANVGDMENHGVEFSINAQPVRTKDLTWNLGFNVTYNQNKITNLTISADPNFAGNQTGDIAGGTGNTIQINSVGYPRGSFYVLQQVYDGNGKPIEGAFVDRNRDGLINEQDLYRYKQADPKAYLGLSSSVNYKNWSAAFTARANLGNYVYNNVISNTATQRNILNPIGNLNNGSADVLYTGFTGNVLSDKYFLSDYYVENASFLRMDNINIGYTFGNLFKQKATLRISGNVQNVFTITKYKGIDPEINNGIDNNFYPRPRTYVLGLNLNF